MDKKLLIIGILFIVTFIIYIVIAFFRIPIFSFTQAANENRAADISTSLIFAWPLELSSTSEEPSEITVFIRDNEGRGIPEKQVRVTSTLGELQGSPSITDDQGKVTFLLTSSAPGVALVEAYVDNRKLQKTISVQFE